MDQLLEQTIEKLELLIAEEPHSPQHHKDLGNAFHSSRAYDLALEEFRTALHIDPNYYKAQYNMGNTCFAMERYQEAIICWQKALIIEPKLEHAIYNIAFTYFTMGTQCSNSEIAKHYFDDAALEFQKAISLRPDNVDSHLHLGLTWYELECYDQSVEEYNKVIEADPEHAYAFYNLGNVYYELGEKNPERYRDALSAFKTAIKLNPEDDKSHNNVADCYLRLGQIDMARKEALKVLKIFADYLPAHCTLGETYAADDKHPEAIQEFKRILELDPEENHVLHKYAARKLIEEYNRLILKTPDSAPLHYELGLAYKDLGIAYKDNAYLHKAEDEFRKAIDSFEVNCDRTTPEVKAEMLKLHIELGETYLLLNNLDFALMEIESALIHDNHSVEAHCILGEIYVKAGDTELACGQFSYIKKEMLHKY
jgi:superkiller protein 3